MIMELMIGFPNGDERKVVVSSARRAINRKTGMKELVINYVDGGNKHYTPLVNILGKWYKNLDWVDYGEYAFDSVEYDYLSDLPLNLEVCDPYSEFSDLEITNYCNAFRNKIANIVGRRKTEFLDNSEVNENLNKMYSEMKNAIIKTLNSNNIAIRGYVYWVNETVLFKISNSLDNISNFIDAIKLGYCKYLNIDVDSITERYDKISKFTAITSKYGKEHLNFIVFALDEVDILAMTSEEFNHYINELDSCLENVNDKMLNRNVLSKFMGIMKIAIKYKNNVFSSISNAEISGFNENKNIFVVVDPGSLRDGEEIRTLFYSSVKDEVDFTMKFLPITVSEEVISDVKNYLEMAKNSGTLLPLQLKNNQLSDVVYYFGLCDNRSKFNYLLNAHGSMEMIQIDVTKKSIVGVSCGDVFSKGMNGAYTLRIPSRGRIYYGLES